MVFNGTKVSCFAYGQTGSGKTFTMIGDPLENNSGLYFLAANELFDIIKYWEEEIYFEISYFEIYCEKLYDLLNNRNQLFAREDSKQNINIIGLETFKVSTIEEFIEIINMGNYLRITSKTGKNDDSSRSHAILQFYLKTKNKKNNGILSFIDLAGNERGSDRFSFNIKTKKQTKIDGAEISKSLWALKEFIRALDKDKSHIPFRGSKLTMVLKDSFIGNCKTIMIGTISPTQKCCEYTLNTLRYAERVKELKNNKRNKKISISSKCIFIKNNKIENNNKYKKNLEIVNTKEIKKLPKKLTTESLKMVIYPKTTLNSKKSSIYNNFKENKSINKMSIKEIEKNHDKLVTQIITDEEELIKTHKNHIDKMFFIAKEEMNNLNEVDKPNSDIEIYINNLLNLLKNKKESIINLKYKLNKFKNSYEKNQNLHNAYLKKLENE